MTRIQYHTYMYLLTADKKKYKVYVQLIICNIKPF